MALWRLRLDEQFPADAVKVVRLAWQALSGSPRDPLGFSGSIRA
jgi:hypothetical protein